jgi:hypothetical protein
VRGHTVRACSTATRWAACPARGSTVDVIAVAIGLAVINTDAPDNEISVIYDLLDNAISAIAGVLGRTVNLVHVGNSADLVVGEISRMMTAPA